MNVENIKMLADYIENNTTMRFSMGSWSDCIQGFAQSLWSNVGYGAGQQRFAEKLGLTGEQSDALTMPHYDGGALLQSRADAVATLRKLAETGIVQWPDQLPPTPPADIQHVQDSSS